MRYDGELNGQPTWNLLDALSGLQRSIGGLERGQEITLEEVRLMRQETREDVVRLHERIDSHMASPSSEKRGWIERSGLSLREVAVLVAVVITSLTGTLSSDVIAAWLGH